MPNHRRFLQLIVAHAILCALVSAVGGAQQLLDLPVGTRVRVHREGFTVPTTGTLAATAQDTIRIARVVRPDTVARDTLALALASVREVYVSQGLKERRVARNALGGCAIGAAVGGVLGAALALGDPEGTNLLGGTTTVAAVFAGVGGASGLVIGAATGLARQEVWVRVPIR